MMKYPCKCCGNLTLPVFSEEAVAYICPVCLWENDVFIQNDEPGDENHGMTLNEAREKYLRFNIVAEYEYLAPRAPKADELPLK